jgi:hypothetical protein
MMAPAAKPPMMAGPHHPRRASAVVGVATAAMAIVAAAATAVRVVLMTLPRRAMKSVTVGLRGWAESSTPTLNEV